MAGMTAAFQKDLLDAFLDIATYTWPAEVFLSLHTGSPTEAGSRANEISTSGGSGYGRESINGIMTEAGETNGTSQNTTTITFGPAGTAWGTIVWIGIDDAETSGNMCIFGAPTAPKTINIGQTFKLVPSQLSIRFD